MEGEDEVSEILDKLSQEAKALKTKRDELRVQLDLGKMEARDRWEQAEKSWDEFEEKLNVVAHETGEALRDVGKSTKRVLEEIREHYREIRKLI
jgi:broad specificity phosphatase PhoE